MAQSNPSTVKSKKIYQTVRAVAEKYLNANQIWYQTNITNNCPLLNVFRSSQKTLKIKNLKSSERQTKCLSLPLSTSVFFFLEVLEMK